MDLSLTLDAESQGVGLSLNITNTVRDHRLRIGFNTGYRTDTCYAGQPFDILARTPNPMPEDGRNRDEPNNGMLCVEGPEHGIAVFNKGLYEYEYPAEQQGHVALTLVRANNRLSAGAAPHKEFSLPGNQCQRELAYELWIRPYQNDYLSAGIMAEAKSFHNPLLSVFQPVDRKKFTGGRPAVQDSDIKEHFYRPLPFPDIVLPLSGQFFEILGEQIQLSALKRGEDDAMLVLRLWHAGQTDSAFGLRFQQPLKRAAQLNLNEETLRDLPVKDLTISNIPIKSREIITLGVWM